MGDDLPDPPGGLHTMTSEQWGLDRNVDGVCSVCNAKSWMWCDQCSHQQQLLRATAERDGWKVIATELLTVAIGPGATLGDIPPIELVDAAAKEMATNVELFWNAVMEKRLQTQLLTGQQGSYQRLLVSHTFLYNAGAAARGSRWVLRFQLGDGGVLVVHADEVNRQRVAAAPAHAPAVQECRCGGRSGTVRFPPGHDITAGCPVHGRR